MKAMLSRLLQRPGVFAALLVASLFANVLALAPPLYVIQVLNRYLAHGVDATLYSLAAGVVIAIGLEYGFRQVRARLASGLATRSDAQLSMAVFSLLAGARLSTLSQVPRTLRHEALQAASVIQKAFNASNIGMILDLPFALLFVLVLFLLHPMLGWVAAVFVALAFALGLISLGALRITTRRLQQANLGTAALAVSLIESEDTVRAFNGGKLLNRQWRRAANTAQHSYLKLVRRQGVFSSLNQSLSVLLGVAMISVGATLVLVGEIDVGVLIGANILASRAMGPVIKFVTLSETLAAAAQALNRVREFSQLPMERSEGSELSNYQGALELKDVAYVYPGGVTPLFESVSLRLQPGEVLVVTGNNGTGKTSLARMLVGLIEPSRGQVLVDGVDLRQVVAEWWRSQLVYLPQEPGFIHGSLRDNMLLLNPEMADADIATLVRVAGLRSFLDSSTEGLDMPLRDNGRFLSLGIRRRITLARALSASGRLVVFDEPTEGMDAEGNAAVYRVLNELVAKGRSIIVCSHDAQILRGANWMLDLNEKPVPRLTRMERDSGAATSGQEVQG